MNLPKAVEYFQKAGKYARPRDVKQAAEAEFFAGLSYGLQQAYEDALRRMEDATRLNGNFFEAHYMRASFAGLLNDVRISSEALAAAITGDARYFERCKHDQCFDKVRPSINSLLAQMLGRQELATNSKLATLKELYSQLGTMGVPADITRNLFARTREVEDISRRGGYAAFCAAELKALELGREVRTKAMANIDQRISDVNGALTTAKNQFNRDLEQAKSRVEEAERELKRAFPASYAIAFLVVSILSELAIVHYWETLGGKGILGAIFALIVGMAGVMLLIIYQQAKSKLARLRSAEGALGSRSDLLQSIQDNLSELQRHKNKVEKLASDLTSARPFATLAAAS